MKISKNLFQIIQFSLLPVAIFSVLPYFGSLTDNITTILNTNVWWIIQVVILYAFVMFKNSYLESQNKKAIRVIQWYILWITISIIRGLFIAETYWDWKSLITHIMALLLPMIAYAATNKDVVKIILFNYIKYTLPLFIVFAFLIDPGAYGFYLVPISFLILFLPAVTNRWKGIILFISLIVITADLGARSNVIKFGVPLLLSLIYYLRFLLTNKHYELLRILLFITPFILFGFALTGTFNVFRMDEYIKNDYVEVKTNAAGEEIEENLIADTRTFLYVDVLKTAQKYNSWLIGRSPARGNESETFGEIDLSGRGERAANEVAILNIFTWTGIIGVMLYFFIFYKASYLAINQSNNTFVKIIGVFIAFRWLYAWVEDVNDFSLTTFMLWLMIGLCFSSSFRKMTNEEVKYWTRSIFDNANTISLQANHRKFLL